MSVLPSHLKYSETGEWVFMNEFGHALVGITDFAQESLGEVTNVHFPELGADVGVGDEVMSLESIMAAAEILTPVSGEIIEINEQLEDDPEMINDEPYDSGWLFKIAVHDEAELEDLMNPDDYQTLIDGQ